MPNPGTYSGGRDARRRRNAGDRTTGEWVRAEEKSRKRKEKHEARNEARHQARARQYQSRRLQALADKPDMTPYLRYIVDPVWGESDTVADHIVVSGETLSQITESYLGTSHLWRENWRLNPEIEDAARATGLGENASPST